MNDVPQAEGREPASLVQCPRCRGTGRVGPAQGVCILCWCRGQIEFWRWQQLMDDEARRASAIRYAGRTARKGSDGRSAASPQDSADPGTQGAACLNLKCGLTERCPQCPFGPFILAA